MDQFLKITYHLGAKKINAYLKMPSPNFHVVKKEIELCLFEERKLGRCEFRTYWIDEDRDEIEIVNQCDYEIFKAKSSDRKHLQVAPIGMETEDSATAEATKSSATSNSASNQAKIPPAADSYDFAVHDNVECDACLMAPIMGFRYKCIQCPNYDLCQNCESKHIHSEHMMVRMPTKNCPNVIEAYITGRNSGRRHGKRSKTSCPFIKNGLSVIIDDDAEATKSAGGENVEQSSPANGRERHHGRKHNRRHERNNFFSHLYEMMHDLAEGGGAAAAAHAMGETATSSQNTTFASEPQMASTSTTKLNDNGFENAKNPIAAVAAAAAAKMAAQQAHETATKAAEIAAKVAHETALKATKSFTENMNASASTSSSATADGDEKEKEQTNEKVDATTSPRDPEPQPNTVPVIPSPSLESLAQFLDPQFMKTGVQILNNFSDMFAKMLDPMENSENGNNQNIANLRKNSTTSTQSSVSSNLNSLGSDIKCDDEKSIQKDQTPEKTEENKKTSGDSLSHVEVDDLGSDSENESVSESFVKIYTPLKEKTATPSTPVSSVQTTPPQSLDKSNVMDFAQLGADLKAHIAQEAAKASVKSNFTTAETAENAKEALSTITSTTASIDPVITTSTTTSSSTAAANTTTPNKPEEKRAVPVYHTDQRINNAVNAMMSMGFSNEGAWLTQLLESVNGNIPEALDLMSVAQRNGGR